MVKTALRFAFVALGMASILSCSVCAQHLISPKSPVLQSSDSVQSLLQKPLRSGEAYVWYLLHCGYAVRTSTKLLIFDYVRTTRDATEASPVQSLCTGRIDPAEIKDLDVYVFVTHSHEDHYDPIILDWQDQVDHLTYIFGWQATDDSSHHHLVGPRASLRLGDMDVYTINCRSGVPEVAYLIKTDGLAIFFQGDYKSDSLTDIDYLLTKCDTVDIAFFGATTRRWPEASARIARMMERTRPRAVFPMHFGGQEETCREFAQECAERGLPFPINCPNNPGDQFHYMR